MSAIAQFHVLPGDRLANIIAAARPAAGGWLCSARGSDWLVIPAASAARLLTALESIDCKASDVTAFVVGERSPDGVEEKTAGVGAAFAALR